MNIQITKPTEAEWVAWALDLNMPPDDYELLDYLMACMAYDMGQFSASDFTAGSLNHLLHTYGDDITTVGNKLYKHYLREKQSAR